MTDSIRTQLGEWWQATLAWDPHWIVQSIVVALLVWVLSKLARWLSKWIREWAKRNYAEMVAIQEKQEAERQSIVHFVGLKVRLLEHGGISAIAGIFRSTIPSLILLMMCMTTVIVMVTVYDGLTTIGKIIGWAFGIATFIGAIMHLRDTITILEGIEAVEEKQLDELIKDDEGRQQVLDA